MDSGLQISLGLSSHIDIRWIILPAAILAMFTLLFLIFMARRRMKSAKDGSMDPKYFRLYQGDGLTDELQLWNRHFNNLLEIPILFYFAVVVAIVTHQVTLITVTLSWFYLGFRLLHSWIHLNGNRVIKRFTVFGLSVLTLFILWVTIVVGLFI